MNLLKKLFGGGKSSDDVRREEAKNFGVLKYDGVRALRAQQYDYAVKCFVHALELDGGDLECRDYLSRAYMAVGDLLNAYEQLRLVHESAHDNVAVLLRMAEVAYMMENYTAMSEACEKALLVDGDNVEALFLYAKACRGQGDATNAVAMLTKAIGLSEDFDVARLLRGSVLLENGDVADAALDADYLYERIEGSEDVLLLKARVEKASGRLREAVEVYGKVVDVNPFSIDAYRERGEALRALGDEAAAAQDEAMASEMEADAPQPTEGIGQEVKQKLQQIDPYKVFNNDI